jgi:hypothetical protein
VFGSGFAGVWFGLCRCLLKALRVQAGEIYVVAQPPYVVIDLSCVTDLRRRRPLAVAIWEHVWDGRIENTARVIDALVFL